MMKNEDKKVNLGSSLPLSLCTESSRSTDCRDAIKNGPKRSRRQGDHQPSHCKIDTSKSVRISCWRGW